MGDGCPMLCALSISYAAPLSDYDRYDNDQEDIPPIWVTRKRLIFKGIVGTYDIVQQMSDVSRHFAYIALLRSSYKTE